jgi:hypothetical protein
MAETYGCPFEILPSKQHKHSCVTNQPFQNTTKKPTITLLTANSHSCWAYESIKKIKEKKIINKKKTFFIHHINISA